MKTIPVEQLDYRLAEMLKQRGVEEPFLLTQNSTAVGLLVRVPEGVKEADIDFVWWAPDPSGGASLLLVQVKAGHPASDATTGQPVFGSCRGLLKVVAEDDEHLKDFDGYMR